MPLQPVFAMHDEPNPPTLGLWSSCGRDAPGGLHPGMSLSEFFEQFYRPHLEGVDAHRDTIGSYKTALKHWRCAQAFIETGKLVSDADDRLAVADVRPHHGAWVKRYLAELGRARNTIVKTIKHLQYLVDAAGQPNRERRGRPAAALLGDVPYLECPRLQNTQRNRYSYTLDEWHKLLFVCPQAWPYRGCHVPMPVWWDCYLRFAVFTGRRQKEILLAEWSWIEGDVLVVPPEGIKREDAQSWPLSPQAMRVVERLRRYRRPEKSERIFPFGTYPNTKTSLNRHFDHLIDLAGVRQFPSCKSHGLRRLHVQLVASVNEHAARKSAGHAAAQMTVDRYETDAVLREALEKLPEPPASTASTGGDFFLVS